MYLGGIDESVLIFSLFGLMFERAVDWSEWLNGQGESGHAGTETTEADPKRIQ